MIVLGSLILIALTIRYLRQRRMNRMFQDILMGHRQRLKEPKYFQPEESEELEAARAVFGLYGLLDKDLINNKFRELVKQHHPDKNGDREIFQNILKHRSVLIGE